MSYNIEPTRHGQPTIPADYELMARQQYPHEQVSYDLGDKLRSEHDYRAKNGLLGALDLMLTTKASILLATLGETVQTEREGYLAQEADLQAQFPNTDVTDMLAVDPHSHDPLMLLASIPVDAKAAAVSVAAFGLVSAARRIRRQERFPEDARNAVRQVAEADAFIPHNEKGTRMFRIRRRLADAAISTVAVTASYQAAKHGTQMEDFAVAGGLSVAAVGSVYAARFKNWRNERKADKAYRAQNASLGLGDSRAIQ